MIPYFWKVTAAGDQTAKFWDVNAGELIGTCKGHQCSLKSVAFSKFEKGKYVLILFHVLNLFHGEVISCSCLYLSDLHLSLHRWWRFLRWPGNLNEIKLDFSPVLMDVASNLSLKVKHLQIISFYNLTDEIKICK